MDVQARGIRFHVEQEGEGPDLVLLHGLGSAGTDWHRVVAPFARHRRITCPDLRGHGASERPPGEHTTVDLAEDVVAILDALGLEQIDLLGMSMGGMVAQHVAARIPDRIRRLILLNTAAEVRPRDWATFKAVAIRRWLIPWLPMHRTADIIADKLFPNPDQEPLRAYIREAWVRNDPAAYSRATRATLAHDARSVLASIRSPTLVLAGDRDGTIPRVLMEELAAGIPGATLRIIADSGHGTPLDQPERFIEAVEAFLGAPA